MAQPEIRIKRAYDPPHPGDGLRVLVDRVWPRGVSKDALQIGHWVKSAAPSTELRKWFNHDPQEWPQFKKAYMAELRERKD